MKKLKDKKVLNILVITVLVVLNLSFVAFYRNELSSTQKTISELEAVTETKQAEIAKLDDTIKKYTEIVEENKLVIEKQEKALNELNQKTESQTQVIDKQKADIDSLKKELDKEKTKNRISKANVKNVEKKAVKSSSTNSKTEEKKSVATTSKKNVTQVSAPRGKSYTVQATAYTAFCNGCSGVTATGIDLRANPNQKVIAVDPKFIKLGSRVWVEGYGVAIAGDTGGRIKGGNIIDVFIPNQKDALNWGRRTVNIKVLD